MESEYEEMFLCKPCAEKIKSFKTCEDVRIKTSVRDKGLCEQCNRRRYGYFCDVKFKEI